MKKLFLSIVLVVSSMNFTQLSGAKAGGNTSNITNKIGDTETLDTITQVENTQLKTENHKVNDSLFFVKDENNESYFNLYYSKSKNNMVGFDSIIIKNKTNKKIQKIKLKKDYFLSEWEIYFNVNKDVNFDGINDIELVNYKGNYNSSFTYWVYHENNHKYKHIKSLDSIYNPVFDSLKRKIFSEYRIPLSSEHSEEYFWKNNEIILEKEKITYHTNDSTNPVIYTRKLVDGKYIEKGKKY